MVTNIICISKLKIATLSPPSFEIKWLHPYEANLSTNDHDYLFMIKIKMLLHQYTDLEEKPVDYLFWYNAYLISMFFLQILPPFIL